MKKILAVVDMQNDFMDGSLGTKEAQDWEITPESHSSVLSAMKMCQIKVLNN